MRSAEPLAFGVWLRQQREASGLTQDELARRAGITAREIATLERGRRQRPYPRTLQALADALELPAEDRTALLEWSPDDSAPTDSTPPSVPFHVSARPLIG
ncbi:MAG TPA: helix-turn-helix transcriptional regulator, partial [Thermomicrobiales bacterium]|nr:helix-turn-helix transcriptional regulator [Thermomicrobiales bacterium]